MDENKTGAKRIRKFVRHIIEKSYFRFLTNILINISSNMCPNKIICVYIVQIQRRIGAYIFIVYFRSLPSKGFNLIEVFYLV